MAQTIKLKRSAVSGNTPSTSDLELGEIAINTYDGKVFIKKNDGSASVVEVGAADNTKLPLTGGTMTGAINMGGNNLTNGGNATFTNLTLSATEKLRFDGSGGHTFIHEASNDTLVFATGNSTRLTLDANATFTGNITANAISGTSLSIDTLSMNGSSIGASGNLTLDVAGDITLDADGRDVFFADGGTNYFQVYNDVSNNAILNSVIQDKDIKFTGNDGGSTITALTLDMSNAGAATFNSHVNLFDSKFLRLGNDADFIIYHDGTTNYVQAVKQDSDIIFRGNDGGSNFNALTLDMSAAGAAIFNANVTASNLVANTAAYIPIVYGGSSSLQLKSNTSELFAQFVNNGAAELYHDNVKKFETTSTGVAVTGSLTTSANLTVSGNLEVTGTTTQTGSIITNSNFTGLSDANSSNATDFGFYGKYVESSTTKYAGVYYDASVDNTFKFFCDTQTAPTTTVNEGATGYALANVQVAGLTVGGTIANTSGNMTLDSAGTIVLDADNAGVVQLKDGGSHYGSFFVTSDSLNIQSNISDADIIFKGSDGGSGITALTLDMSSAGEAIFNSDIRLFDSKAVRFGTDQDFRISNDGNHTTLQNSTSNQDILFKGNDDGTPITALTLDMSNAGKATFSGIVSSAQGFERGDMFITQNEIDVSSGDLLLDVAGTIKLDADNSGTIYLQDAGNIYGIIEKAGSDLRFRSGGQDADIVFMGNDGGSLITALRLDMSDAGAALFNSRISATSADLRNTSSGAETTALSLRNYAAGANTATALNFYPTQSTTRFASIVAENVDGNNNIALSFLTSAGDTPTAALTLNQDRSATFSSSVRSTALISGSLLNSANNSLTILGGGSATSDGANLTMYGSAAAASAGEFRFRNGTSEKMRLDSSGNLGIGTSAPASLLNLSHATAPELRFSRTGTGQQWVQSIDSSGRLLFLEAASTGGTLHTRMVIDDTGEVGIGTGAPSSMLHVAGGSATIPTLSSSYPLTISNNGNSGLNIISSGTTNAGQINFGDSGDADAGRIRYDHNDNSMRFTTNATEYMRITSAGRVSVGTSTPARTFHVVSSDYSVARLERIGSGGGVSLEFRNGDGNIWGVANDGDEVLRFYYAGVNRLQVTSGGAVTFNSAFTFPTADGSAGQVLKTDGSGNLTFQNDSGGGSASSSISDSDGDTKIQVEEGSDEDKIRFDTAGSERMIIDNSGNIGINTSAPTQGLQISSKNLYMQAGSILMSQGTALFMNASNGGIRHGFHSTGYGFEGTNVGIGTTAPDALLHVSATSPHIDIGPQGGNRGKIGYHDLDVYIGSTSSTGEIHFKNNISSAGAPQSSGDTKMVIADSGVGIGTTSPGAPLVVNSTSASEGLRVQRNGSSNQYLSLHNSTNYEMCIDAVCPNGSPKNMRIFNTSTGSDSVIRFGTSNAEKMRLDSSGNLGIGTTAPTARLDVRSANGGVHSRGQLYLTNTDSHAINQGSQISLGGTYSGTSDTYLGSIAARKENATSGDYAGYLQFGTRPSGSANVERMRITSAGNVGIGTTAPSANLHVKNTSSNAVIKVETAGGLDSRLILDAPAAGGAQSQIFFDASGTTAGSIQYTHNSGGTNFMTFHTGGSNAERIRITSAGNVGIGVTAPAAPLTVNNYYASASSNNIFVKNDTSVWTQDDPHVYHAAPDGILVTADSSRTDGPDKMGLVLYNDNNTAGGFSPMLLFAKRETGSTPYRSAMAGIYAKAPSGTGTSDAWIDGQLHFATAGASSQGIKSRMVIDKEGKVGIGTASPSSFVESSRFVVGSGASGTNEMMFLYSGTNTFGALGFADGTSGTEAYRGIMGYDHNTDTMFFSTAGGGNASRDMIIGSNGGVSIGTSTAAGSGGLLVSNDIKSNSRIGVGSGGNLSDAAIYKNSDTNTGIYWPAADTLGFTTAGTERIRITSGGDVSIGSSHSGFSTWRVLNLRGQSTGALLNYEASDGTRRAAIANSGSELRIQTFLSGASITFESGTGSEKARINGDGYLLVGKTNTTFTTVGTEIRGGNLGARIIRSNAEPLTLHRTGSSGIVLNIYDQSTEVGSIATEGGDSLVIQSAGSTGSGLRFHPTTGNIDPIRNGARIDNTVSIGTTTHRFKDLHLSGTANVGGNLVVTGNLTVNGTQTTLNTATLQVEDKNIVLNYGSGDTSSTADGAGITIQDAVNSSTDASFTWRASDDKFISSHPIRAFGGFELPDNNKLFIGDGNDLQIFHDGSDSFITNTTGQLILRVASVENALVAVPNGAVTLYHNNSAKMATASGGVSVTGTLSVSSEIDLAGDLNVGDSETGTTSVSTSATTSTNISSFSASAFRSAKYLVQVTNTTDSTYHTTEILIIHDGTDTYMTEYGSMFTGTAAEATFTSDISSGSVRLLATPASTDSMTFKVLRNSIIV